MTQLNLPKAGDPAPEFTTVNQDGKEVSLADYRGKKVVLYFYPKAMTPGCTTQACGLRDTKTELDKRNAVAIGISPDAPKRLTRFIEKEGLNFDLLSDEDHSIADKFGVWGMKKFMGREFEGIHRITFIIDEDGKLAHVMEKVKTKSHHDDVLAVLDEMG
ncbi:thioredoxin-dependent thiol peroxidase [Saccharospirillum salsuginis]|uniref:thioredoxin-dependent peroxiredoxin n=1 Tax=Saccharospirillum salsuginis TaxID=418750 RepID=A0A918KIC2_9GAMM|nr:thioredoxin-dependent thiol peroxidase [Saccharospirillum salsuginis]GGX64393.1 peroxiredoxin [Saccharospirillum salsuginis]